jgi:hypothetical protein
VRQVFVLLIRRWPEQASRIHRLTAWRPDQIVELQDLGDPQLGRIELETFDMHHHHEDRMWANAGAVSATLALVPAPRRVLVVVVRIRTVDVRRAVLPGDP